LDHDGDCSLYRIYSLINGIWYTLLSMSHKVQHCFHYHSKKALASVELPPNLLGFVYCAYYVETSLGERINLMSDHVLLWYDALMI